MRYNVFQPRYDLPDDQNREVRLMTDRALRGFIPGLRPPERDDSPEQVREIEAARAPHIQDAKDQLLSMIETRYFRVATTDGLTQEEVFAALQNGVHTPSWSREPLRGVTPAMATVTMTDRQGNPVELGLQSLSVGDIIVDEAGMAAGVAMFGFEDLGEAPTHAPSADQVEQRVRTKRLRA